MEQTLTLLSPKRWIDRVGETVLDRWGQITGVAALLRVSVAKGVHFGRVSSALTRRVMVRQVYFTGVQAFGIVSAVALVIGVVLVVEVMTLARDAAAQGLLGNLMVWVVFRELAPLLTMLLVIARSGTAISSEIATMKLVGEIRELEFMGVDPIHYLVIPRLLGMSLSLVCLNFYFSMVSIVGGVTLGWAMMDASWTGLMGDVFEALKPVGILFTAAKSIFAGVVVGAICCYRGLQVQQSPTEIPRETARAVVQSLTASFAVSGVISAVFYLFFA